MVETKAGPRATETAALASELRVTVGKLTRRLREQTRQGELTLSQRSVLSRIDREGPATISELARAEAMRPQSMGAIVASLEAAGLLRGTPHASDGRQTLLALTPACRRLIQSSRAAREDWLARTLESRLTPAEQQKLAHAFKLIARLNES